MELHPVPIGVCAYRLRTCELIVTKPDRDRQHGIEGLGINDAAEVNIPAALLVRRSLCKTMVWTAPTAATLGLVRPRRSNHFAFCVGPYPAHSRARRVCGTGSFVGVAIQAHTNEHTALICTWADRGDVPRRRVGLENINYDTM